MHRTLTPFTCENCEKDPKTCFHALWECLGAYAVWQTMSFSCEINYVILILKKTYRRPNRPKLWANELASLTT